MRGARTLVTLALLLPPMAAQPQFVESDGARDEFRYAWSHIAELELPVADSPKLRRYPLYVYLEAERLRLELSRVPPGTRDREREARVADFLARHAGEPVAHGLRRDLLMYLGSRSQWQEFMALRATWPVAELPDASLRCFEFSARLAAQDLPGLVEKIVSQWLVSRDTPAACAAVYEWIDSPERLSESEIEQRVRFANKERLPLPASWRSLTEDRQAALRYWREADIDPERALRAFLAGKPVPVPPAERALGMVRTFERLAQQDSSRARPLFEPMLRLKVLGDAQKTQLRRSYALGLAWDHDPEAVEQFAHLPAHAVDDLSHEWRLRSALWNDNWRQFGRWLDQLPEARAREPRWQYWRGRLAERRGDRKQAEAAYAAAAREREYYGFLAAERLGQRADLRHQPLTEDWPTLDLMAATPALRRARELLACDLPDQAAAEFDFALRDLPATAKPQAIRLAANWGWHARAVRLQAELGQWNDLWLRFPLPYDGEIEAAARDTGLPPDWLYAVLRTESLYNPRAVSRSGALGLLQLMPATARAVALRSGVKAPSGDDLFRPEINIALGARYLREMNQRFGGALVLTLAAYNAGPQRIPRWLPRRKVDGDIWVENIPFNENRGYVQRALSSLVMIGWRRSGEPAPILPLLGPVKS